MNKKTFSISCMIFFCLFSCLLASAVTIQDVSSSPQEISPGKVSTLSIKIENIFEEDIQNLEIKLDLNEVPLAPYESSAEMFLDELEGEEKETFDFELIALPETPSGIYKIPVEINYELDGDKFQKYDMISVTINSNPELKISLEDTNLIRGRENKIFVKIINSGLSDVKFAYLKTSDISGIEFFTNKEQYIGNLDSDDFDSVEYRILIKPNAPSQINIPIILKYKDSTNKEYIETKTISANVYSLEQAKKIGLIQQKNYLPYFLIGFLIIGYVGYRILKKRKLKKKQGN